MSYLSCPNCAAMFTEIISQSQLRLTDDTGGWVELSCRCNKCGQTFPDYRYEERVTEASAKTPRRIIKQENETADRPTIRKTIRPYRKENKMPDFKGFETVDEAVDACDQNMVIGQTPIIYKLDGRYFPHTVMIQQEEQWNPGDDKLIMLPDQPAFEAFIAGRKMPKGHWVLRDRLS